MAIIVELDREKEIKKDLLNEIKSNKEELAELNLNDLLLTYLNLHRKGIEKRPRKVLISQELKRNPIYKKKRKIIQKILKKLEKGEDISIYLSHRAVEPRQQDLLLNNWGIHHLHLGEKIETKPRNRQGLAKGTKELLFARFEKDVVYLLDIKDHKSFSSKEFLGIIHNNWPKSIEQYRVNVIDISHNASDEEIFQLWNAGYTVFIKIFDNENKPVIYFPIGGGISTARTATIDSSRLMSILREWRGIEKTLEKHKKKIQNYILSQTKVRYNILRFALRMEKSEVYLEEANSGLKFTWKDDDIIPLPLELEF